MESPFSSPFENFNNTFEFFHQLQPNTDVHYSKKQKNFIVTGGRWANTPIVQKAANYYKSHTNEKLIEALNTLFKDITTQIENEIISAQENPDKLKKVISEIKTLNEKFNEAKVGPKEHGGGLQGLAKKMEETNAKKMENLIQETEKTIRLALISLKLQEPNALLEEEDANFLKQFSEISEEEVNQAFDEWVKDAEMIESEDEFESVSFKKMFLYHLTLKYNLTMNALNRFTGWDWWNKVVDLPNAQIYLGAIPLAKAFGGDDSKILKNLGIGAVLSVVESFEIKSPGYFVKPIMPEQWKDLNIQHLHLPTPDFKTMSFEDIETGVNFIHECATKGLPTYVHCKAGRGRSFLIVVCYLIKHHGKTTDEAISEVKKFRPQAGLEKAKLATAHEYERRFKEANITVTESFQEEEINTEKEENQNHT